MLFRSHDTCNKRGNLLITGRAAADKSMRLEHFDLSLTVGSGFLSSYANYFASGFLPTSEYSTHVPRFCSQILVVCGGYCQESKRN